MTIEVGIEVALIKDTILGGVFGIGKLPERGVRALHALQVAYREERADRGILGDRSQLVGTVCLLERRDVGIGIGFDHSFYHSTG